MNKLTKQDGSSLDVVNENLEALKNIFPESFTDDGVEFEVLCQFLGDAVDEGEEKYGDERGMNGYEVLRGKRLKSFKLTVKEQFDTDIGVGIKTQQLGIFDFRAFLVLKTETNGLPFHWAPSSYC